MASNLRFGAFCAPFHPLDENPTNCLDRDLELAVLLDNLGYDELWYGEHHSGGFEIIASPEVMIAAAAERTTNIRLGTGVSSLPYHHPLILAERINQLDHMTKGRVMFGVGPGALPSDAFMMGIHPSTQRDRMNEALADLVKMLSGEAVTSKTDWYELKDARIHFEPYTKPHVEMAVASQVSPSGATAAGTHGIGLLSLGATNQGGFNALYSNWKICEQIAEENGHSVDRKNWRLVGPMHIAETREKARADVRYGLQKWIDYFTEVAVLPLAPPPGVDPVDAFIESGMAVIGTPDDAIEQLNRLKEQSNGGFGAFLFTAHNWADWEATKNSYTLFARHVMPGFQNKASTRADSYKWANENHETFIGAAHQAVGAAVAKHMIEKGKEDINPEMAEMIEEAMKGEAS